MSGSSWTETAGGPAPPGWPIPALGHKAGADHLKDLLSWLRRRNIDHASVYVLSADNIRKRSSNEVAYLFDLIRTVVPAKVRNSRCWQLHHRRPKLATRCLPHALEDAITATAGRPAHPTLAIGYDPQQDLVAAIRKVLKNGEPPAGDEFVRAITTALPGGPVKHIDLVIRTSGERRISGFFPWQSQHAEIHFSNKLWPHSPKMTSTGPSPTIAHGKQSYLPARFPAAACPGTSSGAPTEARPAPAADVRLIAQSAPPGLRVHSLGSACDVAPPILAKNPAIQRCNLHILRRRRHAVAGGGLHVQGLSSVAVTDTMWSMSTYAGRPSGSRPTCRCPDRPAFPTAPNSRCCPA